MPKEALFRTIWGILILGIGFWLLMFHSKFSVLWLFGVCFFVWFLGRALFSLIAILLAGGIKARKLQKNSKELLFQIRRLRRRYTSRLSQEANQELINAQRQLKHSLHHKNLETIQHALSTLHLLGKQHFAFTRKSLVREYLEVIGIAIFLALQIRIFVIEPFKIPSGSMIPTLLVGDHIFVNKFIYGLQIPFTSIRLFSFREPKAGEVIVFRYPEDTSKDFIKRVIGVPGDKIAIKDGFIFKNGKKIPQEFIEKITWQDFEEENQSYKDHQAYLYQETLQERSYQILYDLYSRPYFDTVTVEPGHVFVLGDNRDHSEDSRYWGQVPYENIKGRALFIWWTTDQGTPRWNRIGHPIF